MNAIANAVQTELQTQTIVADQTTGLPVIAGTLPVVKSEAELYAEHRAFISTAAEQVIEACEALAETEKKVRMKWWDTLHRMVGKIAAGNGQQFGREFDAVRQEILDQLAKRGEDRGRFIPSGKAESLAAKWKELEQARSGFSTFSNYASQTRYWVEKVAASVDPAQSPDSFGQTVRNFYTESKAKEKEAASKSGTTSPKTSDKPQTPQVDTGEKAADGVTPMTVAIGSTKTNIRAKGADGKYETVEVNFPTEVIGAMARLNKQIGAALHAGVPVGDIVAALQAAHDMIGEDMPKAKK